ncbi:hypothetical protein ACFX13_009893 [Malus domestica]
MGWNIVRRNLVRVQVTSEADVEFDYGATAAGDDVVRYSKTGAPKEHGGFECLSTENAGTIVYTFQVADPDGGALENLDRNDFNHRTSTQDDWYKVIGHRLHRILARW